MGVLEGAEDGQELGSCSHTTLQPPTDTHVPTRALWPPTHPNPNRHAVYVSVFADGPTRVLRFSDDKNVSSLEAQNIILDLAARLKQVRDSYTVAFNAVWWAGWARWRMRNIILDLAAHLRRVHWV